MVACLPILYGYVSVTFWQLLVVGIEFNPRLWFGPYRTLPILARGPNYAVFGPVWFQRVNV